LYTIIAVEKFGRPKKIQPIYDFCSSGGAYIVYHIGQQEQGRVEYYNYYQ